VTDVDGFTAFYWTEQLKTAGLLVVLTTLGGLGGGLVYGVAGPRARAPEATAPTAG
jgi:hypothetical protein